MRISLTDAGKRFNRDWIFRHFNYEFVSGNSYAIIGPNGSGKSTLLQAVSGAIQLSEGNVQFSQQPATRQSVHSPAVLSRSASNQQPATNNQQPATSSQQPATSNQQPPTSSQQPATSNRQPATSSQQPLNHETFYQYISICAPYLEVIEEMTVKEFLEFHQGFKPFIPQSTIDQMIEIVGLQRAVNKQIRYYSSGMKQRVKLAQAVFSDVPVVLLDEPCTNLDAAGVQLYYQLIEEHCRERLVIVSSNDPQEYEFCKERINIMEWK